MATGSVWGCHSVRDDLLRRRSNFGLVIGQGAARRFAVPQTAGDERVDPLIESEERHLALRREPFLHHGLDDLHHGVAHLLETLLGAPAMMQLELPVVDKEGGGVAPRRERAAEDAC
jgi:hypothetical protein